MPKASRAWWLGLLLLQLASLVLHFWGLSRLNTLVFDETAYARFAHAYLNGQPVFDVHPPLGKLLIAAGMWLADLGGYAGQASNALSGAERAPWAYRWVHALVGSLLPVLVACVSWELFRRARQALLCGVLTLCAGIYLVEARLALINLFLVVFGVAGHWLWLRARTAARSAGRWRYDLAAGVVLGAAVSVKWNGLGFLGVIWACSLLEWLSRRDQREPWHRAQLLGFYGLIPALVYAALWWPHLAAQGSSLLHEHWQMAHYHASMPSAPSTHPYCARWATWPLMMRPISLLFEVPSVPGAQSGDWLIAVHELVNPLLAWGSCLALVVVALALGRTLRAKVARGAAFVLEPGELALGYVLLGFLACWLPWALVARCQFLYLYMPSLVFAILASGWALEQLLARRSRALRWLGTGLAGAVVVAFGFFLPLFLGLPLSRSAFYARMWFGSWI